MNDLLNWTGLEIKNTSAVPTISRGVTVVLFTLSYIRTSLSGVAKQGRSFFFDERPYFIVSRISSKTGQSLNLGLALGGLSICLSNYGRKSHIAPPFADIPIA